MNEKDTIIKLQGEVIEGLKKELNIVYYCADKLTKECKSLSRSRFVMGIGTGLLISSALDYYFSKKKDKNSADSDENQCNEEV